MSIPPDPPHAASALPEPGDMLAGKYRVERVVGVGGMGVVVAATHVQLEERVALKLLKREVMRPETVARFLREARSAAKIKSEHVARVTDVGTLESGVPYMVMELLDGEDLGFLVRERGPLPVAVAIDYVLQAGEAVAEAHALGIVHRDLKPANLVLARRSGGQRVVKVVDFGISKQMNREGEAPHADAAMTRTSAWLGSPLYMSPEQMRSAKDVDARTDLWSLGLILFELCTGHLPFDAPSLVELYGEVMHSEPVPLATWRPDAPPALGAVIGRCLQKDRAQRYSCVAEMALDLAAIAPPGARERIARIVSIGSLMERAGTPRAASTSAPSIEPEPDLPLLLVRASSKVPSNPGVSPPPPAPEPVASRAGHDGGARQAPGARTSTPSAGAVAVPGEKRRRGGAVWLLALVLLTAGGGGAYSRYRTRGWPFTALGTPVPVLANVAAEARAPDLSTTAVTPAASATDVPLKGSSTVDVSREAGARVVDAGSDAGGHRAAVRKRPGSGQEPAPTAGDGAPIPVPMGAPAPKPAVPMGAPAPKPAVPMGAPAPKPPAGASRSEIVVETCTQTLPDGTRKQIPCQ